MDKVVEYFQYGLMVLGAIVPIATALVRLPFLKKYENDVSKFGSGLTKFLSTLPTLGKNPSTKKLEDELEEKKETSKALEKAKEIASE